MGGGCDYYYGITITGKEYETLRESEVFDGRYVKRFLCNPGDPGDDECEFYILIDSPYYFKKMNREYMEYFENGKKEIPLSNFKLDKKNNTITLTMEDFEKICNGQYNNRFFHEVKLKFEYDWDDENTYPELWKNNDKIQEITNFLGLKSNPEHFRHCYLS